MTVIVTDKGFAPEDYTAPILPLADLLAGGAARAVDLAPTDRAEALLALLGELDLVRVAFPAFNDGRGFTIAHDLRRAGYRGRLRATGHVLADQYAMLRRAGFDEAEISDDLARRQPEADWSYRADWQAHDHRRRLFA